MSLPLPALTALTLSAFITVLTESLPAGVLPAMSADLGVSQSAVGQLVTVYAIGTMLTAIPLSSITATWRRRRLLLAGVAGFAVANTVTALSDSYTLTLAARFVGGMAAGLVWSLLAGYARRMAPEHVRGRAVAIAMSGIPLALALGIPAGTFLGEALGWRVTFTVMSVIAVALLAWITAIVPDYPGQPRDARASVARTIAIPGVPTVLLVTLMIVLAQNVLYTYVAPFAETAGLGGSVDALLLTFGIASVVSIVIVGSYIDHRLRALTVAATALIAAATTLMAVSSGSTALVYVAVALWGVGWGGVPTLTQSALAEAADADGDAGDLAQAILVTLWNAATAAGGALGGLLLDGFGAGLLPWAVPILVVPALVVVIMVHGFPPRRRVTASVGSEAGIPCG
ncbi:putative MFS family arabinose efflux permease [Herbihabitans rhizosphaerae]|uniref:Putative MFS family arabinose efflux permease n=1 Tax=Herbihabitans rhizosphaerae TaxID=1872711 RepID=A0A4Q7KZI4_9PSEU|nr:MFS transporter [Herbihabitans rhizosphaerae]RZS41122.1 putative MFS family arabinose efflux permease [Herbihabitans rhizosphaerae]